MLATIDVELDSSKHSLPLLIKLPESMSDFLLEEGYLEPIFGEQRSNVRLRVRCQALRTSEFVPAFVQNRAAAALILMKDLSRSGIGFISHQQLLPSETHWIELMNRVMLVRVVRCRKLGTACFEVGAVVLNVESLV